MFLKLDFQSDVPIYVQLRNEIIKAMAKGELKPGDKLPSVRNMAQNIGINMHTVNKVYNILKSEGFVIIDRRKGALVAQRKEFINHEYIKNLKSNIEIQIAEAICNGVVQEKFLIYCKEIFNSIIK